MARATVWLVVVACAAPRLAALAVFRDPAPTLYLAIADNLAARHVYAIDAAPTAYIEPLYPLLLASARLAFGAAAAPLLIVQIAVASLGGVALFALVRRRSGRDRVAWIATLLYAGSPYLVRQSAAFMEITVATALAVLLAWAIDRAGTVGDAALAGLVAAALVLTRFSFLPAAAAAIAMLARRGAPAVAVAAGVALMTLAPWIAFSRATDGTLLPPRAGENLFVSTSEWTAAIVPRVNVDVLLPLVDQMVRRELGPAPAAAARDRFLLERSFSFAAAHPARAALLKLENLGCLFLPRLLPFTERRGSAELIDGSLVVPPQAARPLASELVAGAFQGLLLAGGAAGLWKRRYHLLAGDAPLLLIAAAIAAVNVIFFPTSRLLAPMTFVLMFYTAVACVR